MTLVRLSAVFSEAPACLNGVEMDTQMGPRSIKSTQWVILGNTAGNTSKAKQSTVGQDATKRSRGSGVGAHGGGSTPGGGERDVPDPSRTHPVTARREEEEMKGRIRREERKEDKLRHADIPATQGRWILLKSLYSSDPSGEPFLDTREGIFGPGLI